MFPALVTSLSSGSIGIGNSCFVMTDNDISQQFHVAQSLLDRKAPNLGKKSKSHAQTSFSSFHTFVKWLNDIPLQEITYHRSSWHKLMPSIRLYIFGEDCEVPGLCKDALHEISKFMKSHLEEVERSNSFRRTLINRDIALREIQHIYDHTSLNSRLRRIFVQHLTAIAIEGSATAAGLCEYPKEFLADMMRFKVNLKGFNTGVSHAKQMKNYWDCEGGESTT